MTHQRMECKHGALISQCRCPAKDKTVVIVDCIKDCEGNEVHDFKWIGKWVTYHGSKPARHGDYLVTEEHKPYPGDRREGDIRLSLFNGNPRDSLTNVHPTSVTVIPLEDR